MLWRLMALTVFCLFHFCGLCRADDCGLRGFDGNQIVHFECEEGTPTSRFRVTTPSGETRGVVLVDIDQPGASRFRVRYNEADGTPVIKALGHISPGIAIDSCEELQMIGYLKAYPLDASYHLSQDIDCAATNPTNSAHSKSLWGLGYAARFPKGWDGKAESGDENVPELEVKQLGEGGFKPLGTFNVTYKDITGKYTPTIFPFTGTFDGNELAIKYLYMTTHSLSGLFSKTSQSTLKNIRFINIIITRGVVGALAGECFKTTILNCHVGSEGPLPYTLEGGGATGGMVGKAEQSTLINCSIRSYSIKGWSTGGLAGTITKSQLSRCQSTVNIIPYGFPGGGGGLVGVAKDNSTISQSAFFGHVNGYFNYHGGLVAHLENSRLEECYNAGTGVTVKGATVETSGEPTVFFDDGVAGGLVGLASGNYVIRNCYATNRYVQSGGVAGVSQDHAEASGGLVGKIRGNNGIIQNCYATVPVNSRGRGSKSCILLGCGTASRGRGGGLIGDILGGTNTISNCFATGTVQNIENNKTQVGGLIGAEIDGTVTTYSNNFWYNSTNTADVGLVRATYVPQKDNTGIGPSDTTGITKVGAQSNFYGTGSGIGSNVYSTWDFTNVWKSRSGNYPCLRWDKNCY